MKTKLIIPIVIMFFLTSCAQVVVNTADEIRLNRWSASLQNGSTVKLNFKNDTAEFCVKSKDNDAQITINGLCFFDKQSMLIYDKKENEPYIFEYKIKNNKLILKHSGGRLVLTREN